jgi:hypothetical protein
MNKAVGTILVVVAAGLSAGAAFAAGPPSTAGNGAFTACLKAHGVILGKTTDQTKIGAAFRACRASAPGGGFAGRFKLTAAQRAAFQKYTACLAKHGVKIDFRFRRPPGGAAGTGANRPPNGQRRPVSAKVRAAQKACASLRPAFPGRRAGTGTNAGA